MKVRCDKLSLAYASKQGQIAALHDVSFTVESQEFVCIVGPSGCGKSTLLKVLAGLLSPDTGMIELSSGPEPGRLPAALIFQEHGLFPWMTVLQNVAFGLEMQGVGQSDCLAEARLYLAKVGLTKFGGHYPNQLSGGMKQRVAVGRAFVADAQMLLMDEPFAALDAQTKLLMQEHLLQLWAETQKTVIYVTHDITEAVMMADRILVLSEAPGAVIDDISVALRRPRTLADRHGDEAIALQQHIWQLLERSVRNSFAADEPA